MSRPSSADGLHVAIIMDGNGRWAEARGRVRAAGHREGAHRIREVVTRCREIGVRYLTLYAFSAENWGRPAAEVGALMTLLARYLSSEPRRLAANGVELAAVGDLRRLPAGVRERLEEAVATTRGGRGLRLTLALSYGGRNEIARAVRRVVDEVRRGLLAPQAVDEGAIGRRLDSAGTPDPDLVIRTGGEHRLSNFLLWQTAYSELYFTDVPWPEFGPDELERALAWYGDRQRRFGLLAEAVSP